MSSPVPVQFSAHTLHLDATPMSGGGTSAGTWPFFTIRIPSAHKVCVSCGVACSSLCHGHGNWYGLRGLTSTFTRHFHAGRMDCPAPLERESESGGRNSGRWIHPRAVCVRSSSTNLDTRSLPRVTVFARGTLRCFRSRVGQARAHAGCAASGALGGAGRTGGERGYCDCAFRVVAGVGRLGPGGAHQRCDRGLYGAHHAGECVSGRLQPVASISYGRRPCAPSTTGDTHGIHTSDAKCRNALGRAWRSCSASSGCRGIRC